ncbi:MAG: DUF4430 domain-containing protein [Clostridiales bacterium]|nr:DUF4430 domain-containing protein [Clostridiales bacterium]
MLEFLKKHKIKFISLLAAAAVLSAAFMAGGSVDNGSSNGTSLNTSTSDTALVTTTAESDDAAAENSSAEQTVDTSGDTNGEDNESTSSGSERQSSDSSASVASSDSDSDSDISQASDNSQSSSDKSTASSSDISNSKSSSSGSTDKYNTESVPEGKPQPVEPEDQEISDNTLYCTFSISCSTILDNMNKLDSDKTDLVPDDGWILSPEKVEFSEGESVFDVLQRVCQENSIHLEFSWTPVYNSAYIEGINNLYEFDCGSLSGWMYSVNDWFPNYGCSRYQLQSGDVVEWQYTCDLGYDIGAEYITQ